MPGTEEPFVSLKEMIEKQGREIDRLSSDIDQLRELINQMIELNNLSDEPIKAWEISRVLSEWASPDKTDDL